MTRVPLPMGLRGVEGLPRLRESVDNLLPVVVDGKLASLLSRPGVATFATAHGGHRGAFDFKGKHYRISGQRLIQLRADKTWSDIAEVPGGGQVIAAVDHATVALVDRLSGDGFEFDGSTLSKNTSAYYVPSIDVEVINGTFVYVPKDGSPCVFSEIGTPRDILAASFFDAEESPDVNKGVINLNGEFYVCGADTIEVFRYTGPATAPLQRVLNGAIAVGYLGGKVEFRNQVAFVGREGGAGIFTLGGGVQRISTPEVDEVLEGYTDTELEAAIGMRLNVRGHDVLLMRVARDTFAYSGAWSRFSSADTQDTVCFTGIDYALGRWLVGHGSNGKIGELSFTSKDEFGEAFQRELITYFRTAPESNFGAEALEVDTVSEDDSGSLGLMLSHDGIVWSQEARRDLPSAGAYNTKVEFRYPGGLGSFDKFMGIRLRTAEPVDFNVDALWLEHG